MKKTIEFKLSLTDPFFVELKKELLEMKGHSDLHEYMQSIISPVMNATLKTLREEAANQTQTSELFKFSFDHKENIYPEYHNNLDHNIDTALNRRIHTTTLERITDIVEEFITDYADKQKAAKKVKISPIVNPDKELESITQFISKTWDGFDFENSSDFFKQVWDASNHMLKNHFDQYVFLDFIKQMYDMPEHPGLKINGVKSQDLPMHFLISSSKLHDSIMENWDYSKNVNSILSDIKKAFPLASKARPKEWKKLAKNYTDYEGMDELNGAELKKSFGGMHSGTAGSPSFEIRTALPHVMYDDVCQGRKPLEVLVGAIVGHAYVMNEKNNGAKMLKEWASLKDKLEINNDKEMTFDFKEPLNQALFEVIKNKSVITPDSLSILNIETKKKKLKM